MGKRINRPSNRPARPILAKVASLGDRGDGIARPIDAPEGKADRLYYLPGALPGETVQLRPGVRKGDGWEADLLSIETPSPDRVAPPCPQAEHCGGCDLQHLAPTAIARWKRDKVVRALAHRGIQESDIAEGAARAVLTTPPGTRRRLSATLRGRAKRALCGFRERGGHGLVDAPHCLLARPALVALMDALRDTLPKVLAPGAEATALMTETETGVDLRLSLPEMPDLKGREALAALADRMDLARLSLGAEESPGEPISARRAPRLTLGGQAINPPPGPFLQPSLEGEAALTSLVLEALGEPKGKARVADLFCGLGTFALPLRERGFLVTAMDVTPEAIAALNRTTRVQSTVRDLFKTPLAGEELADLVGVVVDPPRAGARAQCEALAGDGPAVVVLVSCAPATFARDVRTLLDGGYRLDWVAPVDQFPWSHHVEVVARLTRLEADIPTKDKVINWLG
ncbi:MAG: class I SAM-dependent RNA methyltransferase [Rhodospirillum sp.]|nr:class I SAM-dependent RNA methyltransferase [Rhodospirillum sp.]MCF8492164.1 class I SAM-dependent RNA methyltransferase [Rhodospirillum sp.]MCF8502813.1 class I SAM-dependent RNA methyltransferase [Rhodospirillum sp.]